MPLSGGWVLVQRPSLATLPCRRGNSSRHGRPTLQGPLAIHPQPTFGHPCQSSKQAAFPWEQDLISLHRGLDSKHCAWTNPLQNARAVLRACPCAKVGLFSLQSSQIKTMLTGSVSTWSNRNPERRILVVKSVPRCGKGEAIISVVLLTFS